MSWCWGLGARRLVGWCLVRGIYGAEGAHQEVPYAGRPPLRLVRRAPPFTPSPMKWLRLLPGASSVPSPGKAYGPHKHCSLFTVLSSSLASPAVPCALLVHEVALIRQQLTICRSSSLTAFGDGDLLAPLPPVCQLLLLAHSRRCDYYLLLVH